MRKSVEKPRFTGSFPYQLNFKQPYLKMARITWSDREDEPHSNCSAGSSTVARMFVSGEKSFSSSTGDNDVSEDPRVHTIE